MQPQILNILDIMKDLVSVQSDTGTKMEENMAERIAAYFREDSYLSAHPDHWGLADTNDFLGRRVVWALKEGTSRKTLILTGHYDAVEIDCYGELKPLALKPEALREEMLRQKLGDELMQQELASGDWLPGRAAADMKGGLAIGLYKLLTLPEDAEIGVLFFAVCDEENVSAGMRGAVNVLLELKRRFALDYLATLVLEPQLPLAGKEFMVYNGSIGKIMPVIVARGKLAHCGEPLKGLNAAHLAAEITARIDMSTDLVTENFGLSSPPPAVQQLRDLKTTYDVSLPALAAVCVNLLFLGGERTTENAMKKIRTICEEAVSAVMAKYEAACAFAMQRDLLPESEKLHAAPRVLSLSELEALAAARNTGFGDWKAERARDLKTAIEQGELTLQNASVRYIQQVIEFSGCEEPMVVIGIAPPYYPAVCNAYLEKNGSEIIEKVRDIVEGTYHTPLSVIPYFTGIGDGSYMTCTAPAQERALLTDLMTLPASIYDIPFEASAQLNAPVFYLGPRCRAIHQWCERVYLPDLEHTIPDIIDHILGTRSK